VLAHGLHVARMIDSLRSTCCPRVIILQTPWLDGKHVVFGRLKNGADTLKAMESIGSESGQTKRPVVIAECGQLS
jgi:cyclophilin family peptidyl-prolyl cis-trans isomerase